MKDWREQHPLRTFGGETYKQLVRQIEGILEARGIETPKTNKIIKVTCPRCGVKHEYDF